MPYIGTTPTKVVSRQSANVYRYTATAGQTVFTGADLDNNVLACNPADMIVHMNGLRLESTDYTATSTSVTLTTAATAGDEVTVTSFVTFEVADTYTKTAADDRYVNATGDTMTGNLTISSSLPVLRLTDSDDNSYGEVLYNTGSGGLLIRSDVSNTSASTSKIIMQVDGTERLRIDNAGRVTMPYQPSFLARPSGNSATLTSSTFYTVIFDTIDHNIGGHYNGSTGVFTAPVSGSYQFNTNIRFNAISGTYHLIRIALNGSVLTGLYNINQEGGSYDSASLSWVYYLNANDTMEVMVMEYSDTSWTYSNQSSFSGHLIG